MSTNGHGRSRLVCAAAAAWLTASSLSASAQVSKTGRLSKTAVLVTCFRAIAASDPNPDMRGPDDLAGKLLDPELTALVPDCADLERPFDEVRADYLQRKRLALFFVIARTKFIDESLRASLAQGVRQVVILGAGLDSRSYRIGSKHADVRFFEVDLPATQQEKRRRVIRVLGSLPENVIYVPVDFETQSLKARLSDAGFEATAPAFFIWEGVTMYLTAEAVEATLEYIGRDTAEGSSIVFDYVPASLIDGTSVELAEMGAKLRANFKKLGEPWVFGVPDWQIGEFVARHGLELVSAPYVRTLLDKYLRPGTAEALLGDARPAGGIALARVPAARRGVAVLPLQERRSVERAPERCWTCSKWRPQ